MRIAACMTASRWTERRPPITADASGAMMLSTTTSPGTTSRVRLVDAAAKRAMAHRLLAARHRRKVYSCQAQY
ncbi:hypothetical protein A11M_0105945 [Xanthomonas vasicola pv. vasculorum NCPPB 895]|nr:hypothetical protein A11M_0105945 [Xanthomonas vasicola pv. vasculorum NCPPB 895]